MTVLWFSRACVRCVRDTFCHVYTRNENQIVRRYSCVRYEKLPSYSLIDFVKCQKPIVNLQKKKKPGYVKKTINRPARASYH